MKVAFFSTKSYDREFFDKFNQGYSLTYFEISLSKETVNLTNGFSAICIFVNDKVDKKILESLSHNGVKLILLRCAGYNNIDLEAAKKLGIKIYRVPAYSPEAVAEHAVALIMTLNRKTHKAYNRVRESNFSLERLNGFDLYKKTVGVIGTGNIGKAFCRIMLGFGCQVLAYDLEKNKELEKMGVVYSSLEKVLESSNILSLHCPLNEKTKHIINNETICNMKKGVMLINTSRGALINTKDAIKALKAKQIGYLGIDVYEQEEKLFFQDLSESIIEDELISRLISFPNVLITAHQGFFTNEALEQITKTTFKNISDFENKIESNNQVF